MNQELRTQKNPACPVPNGVYLVRGRQPDWSEAQSAEGGLARKPVLSLPKRTTIGLPA